MSTRETRGPLEIEDGVPMPSMGRSAGLAAVLRKMEVGQSVFVPKGTMKTHAPSLAGTYSRALKPLKFAGRAVEGGTRIWRIE